MLMFHSILMIAVFNPNAYHASIAQAQLLTKIECKLSGFDTKILCENYVGTIAADSMGSCGTKSSAAMAMASSIRFSCTWGTCAISMSQIPVDKNMPVINGCRWPSDVMSQGISKHGTYPCLILYGMLYTLFMKGWNQSLSSVRQSSFCGVHCMHVSDFYHMSSWNMDQLKTIAFWLPQI